MRIREVLIALIDEAKVNHWDSAHAVWAHASADCTTCKAAMGAQTALTINFIDLAVGDPVRIGLDSLPQHFGVVDRVDMVVDVKLGWVAADGVIVGPAAAIGRFNSTALTRLGQVGRTID